MPINYNILTPQNQPMPQTQVISTPISSGGDDLFSGLKGLLGGLKGAFGNNPVSTANQAVTQAMTTGQSNSIASSILPSLSQTTTNLTPNQLLQQWQPDKGLGTVPQGFNEQISHSTQGPSNLQNWDVEHSNTIPKGYNNITTINQGQQKLNNYDFDKGGPLPSGFVNMSKTISPDVGLTMQGIAGVETGGSKNPYSEISKMASNGTQSYGKYQISGPNIPSWTKEALGKSLTPNEFLSNPAAQDATAKFKINQMLQQGHSPNDVASMWFTGRPLNKVNPNVKDSYGTTNKMYQDKFNNITQPLLQKQKNTLAPDNITKATSASISNDPMAVAQNYLGNATGSKTLSNFFQKSGMGNINTKTTPWCAAFANSVLQSGGIKGTGSLAAKSFLNWGTPTSNPTKGDIVVYNSMTGAGPEHGHVGFYDSTITKNGQQYIRTLGGNQDGKVEYKDYPASKVAGFREPPTSNEIQQKTMQKLQTSGSSLNSETPLVPPSYTNIPRPPSQLPQPLVVQNQKSPGLLSDINLFQG